MPKAKNKAIALAYYEEFKTVPQGTVLVAYAKEKFGKKMGVIKAMAMKEYLHKHEAKLSKKRKEELHAPALKQERLIIMGGQVLDPKGHVAFNRHIRQSSTILHHKKVQKADAPQWKTGDRVVLRDMGKEEFNGRKGTVTKYISKHDRFKVKLDDGEVVAIMGLSMRAGLCKAADCVEEDLQPSTNDAPTEEPPAQQSTPDEAPTEEPPAQPSTPDEAPTEDAPPQPSTPDEAPTEEPPAQPSTPDEAPTEDAPAHEQNADTEAVDVAAKPVSGTPEVTKAEPAKEQPAEPEPAKEDPKDAEATAPQEPPTSETADQPEIAEPDESEDSVSSFSDTPELIVTGEPELKVDLAEETIADPGAGVVEERELEPQPPSDEEEAVDVGACANVDVAEDPVKPDNITKAEHTHWTCQSCCIENTPDRNECEACSITRPQDVS